MLACARPDHQNMSIALQSCMFGLACCGCVGACQAEPGSSRWCTSGQDLPAQRLLLVFIRGRAYWACLCGMSVWLGRHPHAEPHGGCTHMHAWLGRLCVTCTGLGVVWGRDLAYVISFLSYEFGQVPCNGVRRTVLNRQALISHYDSLCIGRLALVQVQVIWAVRCMPWDCNMASHGLSTAVAHSMQAGCVQENRTHLIRQSMLVQSVPSSFNVRHPSPCSVSDCQRGGRASGVVRVFILFSIPVLHGTMATDSQCTAPNTLFSQHAAHPHGRPPPANPQPMLAVGLQRALIVPKVAGSWLLMEAFR
jgi:hypothetical protein